MEKVKERFWYQYLDRESPDFQVPEIISEVYESGATLHRLNKGEGPANSSYFALFWWRNGGERDEQRSDIVMVRAISLLWQQKDAA